MVMGRIETGWKWSRSEVKPLSLQEADVQGAEWAEAAQVLRVDEASERALAFGDDSIFTPH